MEISALLTEGQENSRKQDLKRHWPCQEPDLGLSLQNHEKPSSVVLSYSVNDYSVMAAPTDSDL